MKRLVWLFMTTISWSQNYPPAAGLPGSTAVHKDSPAIVAWATGIEVNRGLVNISNPGFMAGGSNYATSGQPGYALGYPDGDTVSLGDGGTAVLTFAAPIRNGDGFDFAVFENGNAGYLELGFVEVSSDGVNFFRFPCHSQTQTTTQLGAFGTPLANYLNNLAGKYEAPYGTPFDLSDLPDNSALDKENITHIKIVDVVGSIDPDYARHDSFGNPVNESFPTPFFSSGFDLQGIGVIHQVVMGAAENSLSSFRIYPNPVSDWLHFSGITSPDIAIFANGQLLYREKSVKGNSVNVSHLQAGIYLVEASKNGQKKMVRLIKR